MNFGWFLIGFLIFATIERLFERRYSNQAVRGTRKMEWSYTAFHTLHIAVFAGTAMEYFLVKRQIVWAASGCGLLLFTIGLFIRLTAIRTLGKFWSLHLEIRDGHRLVTSGIYRYMRHPAYLAIMLEVVSVPLVANSYYVLACALCLYIPLLLYRWRIEEHAMIEKFGDQYVQYCREVPAFIPWRRRP